MKSYWALKLIVKWCLIAISNLCEKSTTKTECTSKSCLSETYWCHSSPSYVEYTCTSDWSYHLSNWKMQSKQHKWIIVHTVELELRNTYVHGHLCLMLYFEKKFIKSLFTYKRDLAQENYLSRLFKIKPFY